MSTTADEQPGRTVVVGTGPAGVTTALGLARRGVPVTLVESGTDRETAGDPVLDIGGDPLGVWGHEPLSEHRRRVVGGTSSAWGGRCIPLDPIDFERRDWVPGSGWPIPYEEFSRWTAAACELLEIPATPFRRQTASPLFGNGGEIDGRPIEVWSPPTHFGSVLRAAAHEHPGLEVMRGTHVVGVRLDEDGRVRAVEAVRDGARLEIAGDRFVLATGTLENTRLLLASPLAAALPALGRYYMSHLFATDFGFRGGALPPESDFFRIGSSYARNRWQLTDAAQREHRVGNVVGFVARPPTSGVSLHVDPLSALIATAKLARHPGRLPASRRELAVYARVLRRTDPAFWARTARLTLRRGGRHRLPMLLPPRDAPVHYLTVQGEHLPDPASRVELTEARDRFGVPRLATRIDFGRTDFETIERFHRAMQTRLAAHGFTPLAPPEEATRSLARGMHLGFNSNAHHIGTTRMGTDAATSVVDPDCRVHGTPNLYVAGAGVFPTSGHANPTLSVVMLAARLADHLAQH